MAPPFKIAEFDIVYGRGVCPASELMARADAHGVLERAGNWYRIGEDNIAQGKENVREKLLSDPELFERFAQMVQGPVGPADAK